jgi:hypothetical protein
MNSRREAKIISPPSRPALHVEILEYVCPFAAGQKSPASSARDIGVNGFRAGFGLHHAVNCLTGRTIK